ncbi:MAG TPA: helix-hairpin-helix domain-containing protein [Candidatus Acidoferrum sp.]|jgi:competence protein ComEA|nr:helix-hairpin-helix domain-containing protein [Candidatus Acidoferrum sp.]
MLRCAITALVLLAALALATPARLDATGASDLMNKAKQLTGPLDLNTASLDDLKKVPGLKDGDAKKITDGRPYSKSSDLVDKKILSPELFDKVKGFVTVK